MQSFYDVVVDTGGNPIAGAQVFVYDSLGVLATLYSDVNNTPQANPIITNADGGYLFYAANGIYSIVIVAAGYNSQTLTGITISDATATPLPISKGGTGQTTQSAAFAALAPSPSTSGNLLTSNGTAWTSATHTGFVFENSVTATGSSSAVVLTKAGNASLDFTNESYLVVFRDITSTTSGTFCMRYTTNPSGNQDTSNVYRFSSLFVPYGYDYATANLWRITPNVVTSSVRWASGSFSVIRPTSVNRTYTTGTCLWMDGTYGMTSAIGCYFPDPTTYGMSFFTTSGNIVGTIELYKLVRS